MKGGTEPSDKRTLEGMAGMQGSLGAIAKDRNGNVNGIREETSEGSKSADFENGQIQERIATHTKLRPSKEMTVAGRFLSEYNRRNNTKYIVGQEQPRQDDITDVLVVDELTGGRMNLQVTVSDESPWILLARGVLSVVAAPNRYMLRPLCERSRRSVRNMANHVRVSSCFWMVGSALQARCWRRLNKQTILVSATPGSTKYGLLAKTARRSCSLCRPS